MEASLNEEMMANIREKLSTLEQKLALYVDPKDAIATLFDIFLIRIELDKKTTLLTPEDYLNGLTELECWYTNRGYPYPYPDRLNEQRLYWKNKLTADAD